MENFREYANYSIFFCFKNTHIVPITKPDVVVSTYTRYVKVNSSLNVRSGPGTNYSKVGTKYNRDAVTIYEESGNWSRIGDGQWVCSNYLTDNNIVNTVGQTKQLKANVKIWSNSDLTGQYYDYLKNTTVKILENINQDVDKIKVPKTGREAYVNKYWYK